MVVVHGQVHAAAGDAGLVREDGQRGLVLHDRAVLRGERRVVDVRAQLSTFLGVARGDRCEGSEPPHRFGVPKVASSRPAFFLLQRSPLVVKRVGPIS